MLLFHIIGMVLYEIFFIKKNFKISKFLKGKLFFFLFFFKKGSFSLQSFNVFGLNLAIQTVLNGDSVNDETACLEAQDQIMEV